MPYQTTYSEGLFINIIKSSSRDFFKHTEGNNKQNQLFMWVSGGGLTSYSFSRIVIEKFSTSYSV